MGISPRNGGFPQQIPHINFGWGRTYANAQTISGFYWNLNTNFLYTQTTDEQFNVFLNVPQNIAQALSFTTNADNTYASVCNQFRFCLLSEECIPFITEKGEFLVIQ